MLGCWAPVPRGGAAWRRSAEEAGLKPKGKFNDERHLIRGTIVPSAEDTDRSKVPLGH